MFFIIATIKLGYGSIFIIIMLHQIIFIRDSFKDGEHIHKIHVMHLCDEFNLIFLFKTSRYVMFSYLLLFYSVSLT